MIKTSAALLSATLLLSFGFTPVLAADKNNPVYMNQHDERWGSVDVTGYSSISTSGCFPTVAAMAVNAVTGRSLTPIEMGKALHENGYYGVVRGNLLSEGTFSDAWGFISKKYGVQTSALDAADITNWLAGGGLVAMSVNSIFVQGGAAHEILITKTDGKGNVYVMDPNNEESNGWYSLKSITSIGSTEWWNQYQGSSFIGIK